MKLRLDNILKIMVNFTPIISSQGIAMKVDSSIRNKLFTIIGKAIRDGADPGRRDIGVQTLVADVVGEILCLETDTHQIIVAEKVQETLRDGLAKVLGRLDGMDSDFLCNDGYETKNTYLWRAGHILSYLAFRQWFDAETGNKVE